MKFEAFGELEFEIKKDYKVSNSTEETYDIILKPIFDHLGMGNARLWLLTSKKILKIVYGFGPTRDDEDYNTIYNTTKKYRDEHMINLLETNPEKFDIKYAKRVSLKTGEKYGEVKKRVRKERLEEKITAESFIIKRKNHLQGVYESQEKVQICLNPSQLITLKAKGIIYKDKENGIYIKTREEILHEEWRKSKKIREQYVDFARFFYSGAFPLYITENYEKIKLGILEFDDLTKIIKDPTQPLPEQDFSWAFNIVNNTIPPILLTQFTDDKNSAFLKYIATSLKKVSDLKDYHGGEHSERVRILSLMVGKALMDEGKFNKKDLSDLELAAMLHDIGKLAISEKILRKKGKLNSKERQIIEKHPSNSVKILFSMRHFDNLVPFVLSHHENFDGTGYPRHLKGESIPLISRILRVADAFDAMAYGRPYKSLIQKKEAIKEIKRNSGIQFDPYIADIFIKVIQTI